MLSFLWLLGTKTVVQSEFSVRESKLALLSAQRGSVEARNMIFLVKPTDQEDGRLILKINILLGLDARFFYRTERDRS